MTQLQTSGEVNVFYLLYRYKWRALITLVLSLVIGYFWLLYAPKVYESEAKLFVRVGWENLGLDPTVNKGDAIGVDITRETEITNMLEHLRSRPILEQTMEAIFPRSPNEDTLSRERVFNSFKNRISITSPKQSMIIRIAAKGDTPEEAQKTVSVLTELYLDSRLLLSRPSGSYEFLLEQSNRLKRELDEAQEELREAKNRGSLASVQGRRTAIESQINSVETRINEISAAISAGNAKIFSLTSSIGTLPSPLLKQMMLGQPNDGLATMRDKLFQLQIEREEVRSNYQPSHPKYIAIQAQVDEITEVLREEDPDREKIIDAICASEKANQAALDAQKGNLQRHLTELRKDLIALNADEIEISRSEMKLRYLETQYLSYAKKTEDARIDNALLTDKISNVHLLQPASLSVLPIAPQKSNTLLLFLTTGVVLGVLVAILSAQIEGHRKTMHAVAEWRRARNVSNSPSGEQLLKASGASAL